MHFSQSVVCMDLKDCLLHKLKIERRCDELYLNSTALREKTLGGERFFR